MERLAELFRHDGKHYLDRLERKFPDIAIVMERKRPIVIYGAGRMGETFLHHLQQCGISVNAFADGNPRRWGERLAGLEILSPDESKRQYGTAAILIASLLYESEIESKLQAMGFKNIYPLYYLNLKYPDIFVSPEYSGEFESLSDENNRNHILHLNELWEDEESKRVFQNLVEFRLTFNKVLIHEARSKDSQYFESGIIKLDEEEVFFDCGAYTGDTIPQFFNAAGGRFKKIYAFEPDERSMTKLRQTISRMDDTRIVPVEAGVYRTSGEVGFRAEGTLDSRINEVQGAGAVRVVSLDDFMRDKDPPTFIKMDIEGAEEDAVLGAKGIIESCTPKLAISVYHRATDLWRLPLLIKKLHHDYRLYLRHYSNEIVDTVCYAV